MLRAMTVICALALFTAAADAASPPRSAHRPPGFLVLKGKVVEGGAEGRFEKVIDLRTGFSRLTDVNGPVTHITGFDGSPWTFENGTLVVIDLPTQVRRARSLAYVDRAGWRSRARAGAAVTPRGGVPIQVRTRAATGHPQEISVESDDGGVTVDYDDWRPVQGLSYPFRQTQKEADGETAVLQVEEARLTVSPPPGALARPRPEPRQTLLEGPPDTAFELLGGSHIAVTAQVNGQDARLIFDTGGANYFGPEAAKRLGLSVSGGVNIGGAGEGAVDAGYAIAGDLRLGRAQLRQSVIAVGPLPWPTNQPNSADGLTGFQFLSAFRTTIDYGKRTLTFASFGAPYPKGARKLPLLRDDIHVYVRASVNGHPGLYMIDTGAGGGVTVFKTFAERHGLASLPAETVKGAGGGIGGRVSAIRVRVRAFSIGGVTLRDLPVDVSQTSVGGMASKTLAGNLGGKLLRCFRLTFDYRDRVLIMEREAETDTCLAKLH